MDLSIVVAVADNGVIGVENRLPWHLPADLQHFKRLTMGKPILMGRKTYESIGRPLPGRDNIILSRQADFRADGCRVVASLDEAIELVAGDGGQEIMVIGGAALYAQALPRAKRIYRTRVVGHFKGDTRLPDLPEGDWEIIASERRPSDEANPHDCVFETLVRTGDRP